MSAQMPLAMAERVEVVIDFAAYPLGTQVVLQGGAKAAEIMRFDVVRAARDDSTVPATLATIEPLRMEQAVQTRDLAFGPSLARELPPMMWTINGQMFDPNAPLVTPRLGEIEIWRFRYAHVQAVPFTPVHPIHLHLVNIQILDRNGIPPAPYETGWKDTVALNPDEEVRVIAHFEGFRGRYVMHCHNLEHEDHAMMARFDVL